jgi:hypothetical protein
MKRDITVELIRGVSGVPFGAHPLEVRKAFGAPAEEAELPDEHSLSWHYTDPDLSLFFETAPQCRLVSCESWDSRATLLGQRVVGVPQLQAINTLRQAGVDDISIFPAEADGEVRVAAQSQSLDLYVEDGNVTAVHWGEKL